MGSNTFLKHMLTHMWVLIFCFSLGSILFSTENEIIWPGPLLQNAFNRTDAPSKVIAHKNANRIVSVYASWNVRETSESSHLSLVVFFVSKEIWNQGREFNAENQLSILKRFYIPWIKCQKCLSVQIRHARSYMVVLSFEVSRILF